MSTFICAENAAKLLGLTVSGFRRLSKKRGGKAIKVRRQARGGATQRQVWMTAQVEEWAKEREG